MYKREWTKTDIDIPNTTTSKITIYDAGAYSYEYLEIDGEVPRLFSWEVINREKINDGRIIETLSAIPDEWVPFDTISSESYPVRLIESGYEIPGWKIQNIQEFREEGGLQKHQKKTVKLPDLVHTKPQHLKHVKQVYSERSAPQSPQRHRAKQPKPSLEHSSSTHQESHLAQRGNSLSREKNTKVGNSMPPSQDPSQKDQAFQRRRSSQYQKRLEAYQVQRGPPSDQTAKGRGAVVERIQQSL